MVWRLIGVCVFLGTGFNCYALFYFFKTERTEKHEKYNFVRNHAFSPHCSDIRNGSARRSG